MTPARYQRLLDEFGLDRPLPVQYGEYVWRALHGDLGLSIVTHEPVFREFSRASRRPSSSRWCAMLLALVDRHCRPASSPRSSATPSGTTR